MRCDFLIDKSNGAIYLNEINTVPGSLAGYLYEDRGFSLKEVTDIMIEEAVKLDYWRSHFNFFHKTLRKVFYRAKMLIKARWQAAIFFGGGFV